MGRPPSSNLAVDSPALAAEWHPSRNDALTPADVSCWTRRSVWWQCPEGHNYQARIASRSNGLRCPRCQSLAWVNPVLAAEWHPSRNSDLSAWDVKSHSSQRVWWCCQAGHEWKASIDNRANGRGCAQCSGHITSTGRVRGTLQEQAPEIAAEWHPTKNGALQPSGVFSHSGRMVWWRCVHGHAWEAQIKSRVTQRTKCGQCSGRAATPERNLRTQAPASADLWHPTRNEGLTPDDVTSGSDRVVWWRCANGHEWQGKVSDRVRAPRCPECQLVHRSMMEVRIEFEVSAFFKVSADHKVEVAGGRVERVDIVLPDERVVVEYDGARYHQGRSREDHEKSERLRSAGWTVIRIREAPLRPLAATDVVGNARDPLVNAVATLSRILEVTKHRPPGLSKWLRNPALQRQPEADSYISERLNHADGSTLADLYPDLAAEWDSENNELRPNQVTPGVAYRAAWVCRTCGYQWRVPVYHRAGNERGCPVCARSWRGVRKPKPGRSLLDVNPALAAEWHPSRNLGVSPSGVGPGSPMMAWWVCAQGHEFDGRVQMRSRGTGCPFCSSHRPGYGNSLMDQHPDLAAEWHPAKNGDLTPAAVMPGSPRRVWWQCANCGREWQQRIDRRVSGSGCASCVARKRWARRRSQASR